ncbi:alpha-L-rhamnosidase C-terminal domain-containing protein [Geminisphaera colitermitum]|uniref:alpha-L-rhamnosidase-related protein n=1 Tax=Geminisphaera colitermitum TaxID=1148786 RepID=UPI000694597E|nr:alpha-L-rhamnosidase C-terminal domain-containing protein [Geminisphaera colitermitum]
MARASRPLGTPSPLGTHDAGLPPASDSKWHGRLARDSETNLPPSSPILTLPPPPPPSGPRTATRLILDLGAINNGHLAFTAFGHNDSTLTFSFFESLEPGAPLRIIWPGACNNSLRYRLRDGWQNFESQFAYGIRYIAIHHEGVSPVQLRDLRIHSAHCGHLPSATLRTGDVALDAIHAICEQTLYAATDDTLTDCPTYETVNWNFDNRLGTLADLVTFRNLPILKNTIEQYARDPLYPALVRSHTPSTWDNRIPVFSFHWIILCRDYHWHTADHSFVERIFPQVARGLDEALDMIDPALGLLRWRDSYDAWHLMDWGKGRDDEHDIVSGEQALLLGALEAGEYLARILREHPTSNVQHPTSNNQSLTRPISTTGAAAPTSTFDVRNEEREGRWRAARSSLRAAIDRHLWLPARDAYADSLHADGTQSTITSQTSNTALALYNVGTPEWRARLHHRLQTQDPALLPYGSPMGLFYILEFLDQRDDAETIFQIIRQKWTPMLAAGDKTAWEHFPEYTMGQSDYPTRSRCHPFATYILKYYVKYLLGLTFTEPGQRTVHLAPLPPPGIEQCQGSIPVADGWIRTTWQRRPDNTFDTTIEAPPAITITQSSAPTTPPAPSVILNS